MLCAIHTLYTVYEPHLTIAEEALNVSKIMPKASLGRRPPQKQHSLCYGGPSATKGTPQKRPKASLTECRATLFLTIWLRENSKKAPGSSRRTMSCQKHPTYTMLGSYFGVISNKCAVLKWPQRCQLNGARVVNAHQWRAHQKTVNQQATQTS